MALRRGGLRAWPCGVGRAAFCVGLLVAAFPSHLLLAQPRTDQRLESRMLRQASARVGQGDLVGAEATLRELIRLRPQSRSAVMALDRVYRRLGRPLSIVPLVNAALEMNPGIDTLWTLKLSALADADSVRAMNMALQQWVRAVPGDPTPYREAARIYRDSGGHEAAAVVIGQGIQALGEQPALLAELGDIHARGERPEEAAQVWARALGGGQEVDEEIYRRIEVLGTSRELIVDRILEETPKPGAPPSAVDAAAALALQEGREMIAVELAGAGLPGPGASATDARAAVARLRTFALQAERWDRLQSARWAYGQIRERAHDDKSRREANGKLAELALEAQDTVASLAARGRIVEALDRGSLERRTAWADELRLRVLWSGETDLLARGITGFRAEFPEAPEWDEWAAALASRLLTQGRRAEAMGVLEGVQGPGASIERAFLLLQGGAIQEGILALQASIEGLDPGEATAVISLVLMFGKLTARGSQAAARIAVAGHRGLASESVRRTLAEVDEVPESDRPAILALGARIADASHRTGDAVSLRRQLVTTYPGAMEFPEAALRLARAVADRPGGRDEAVEILENLIVSRPDHPIVPAARDELARILAIDPARTENP